MTRDIKGEDDLALKAFEEWYGGLEYAKAMRVNTEDAFLAGWKSRPSQNRASSTSPVSTPQESEGKGWTTENAKAFNEFQDELSKDMGMQSVESAEKCSEDLSGPLCSVCNNLGHVDSSLYGIWPCPKCAGKPPFRYTDEILYDEVQKLHQENEELRQKLYKFTKEVEYLRNNQVKWCGRPTIKESSTVAPTLSLSSQITTQKYDAKKSMKIHKACGYVTKPESPSAAVEEKCGICNGHGYGWMKNGVMFDQDLPCSVCGGAGKCKRCKGNGEFIKPFVGLKDCPDCNGTGKAQPK